MGKRIISQRRGRGTTTYRAPSHRYIGKIQYPKLQKELLTGTVKDIVHDPGRSAPLAVVEFDKTEYLIPASEGLKVGDEISCGEVALIKAGNVVNLAKIPEGTSIYAIERMPGSSPNFCTASGTFARVISKTANKVMVKLPSKKEKAFSPLCRATIGTIAGSGRIEKPFVKAGKKHWAMRARGKLYPRMSGVAMNAVDHPFGSGRGRHAGKVTIAPRFAPAGRKVGMFHPRKSGRGKLSKKVEEATK